MAATKCSLGFYAMHHTIADGFREFEDRGLTQKKEERNALELNGIHLDGYFFSGRGHFPYSELCDTPVPVSTASLSAISSDLSRAAMASSTWASVMISGGAITSVSIHGLM
jgi:hypothetical protein